MGPIVGVGDRDPDVNDPQVWHGRAVPGGRSGGTCGSGDCRELAGSLVTPG